MRGLLLANGLALGDKNRYSFQSSVMEATENRHANSVREETPKQSLEPCGKFFRDPWGKKSTRVLSLTFQTMAGITPEPLLAPHVSPGAWLPNWALHTLGCSMEQSVQ